MLLHRLARWTEHGESGGSPELLQCGHCATEFRIDFKDLGESGTGVFYTKWQDIGEGMSYLDPKWQHHIDHIERDDDLMWEEEIFEPGSLCAAFEEGKVYEFDSILTPEVKKKGFAKPPDPLLDECI
ncbi:hypothetical protein ONS96_002068 [Cadophora gregata f. sp. sojae]|nr:hypothetical protein ONS96_002068 [Cadophora gregata f. sp. sojae]